MEITTRFDNFDERIQDLIQDFYQEHEVLEFDDLTTLRSIHLRLVERVLRKINLTWNALTNILKGNTIVHPENAKILKPYCDEEMELNLAQYFVRNDKLIKFLKQLSHHDFNVDAFLAVDGMVGNVVNGPNYEYKNYIQNLSFAAPENGTGPAFVLL